MQFEHRIAKNCMIFIMAASSLFIRFSHAILLNETVFNSDDLILKELQVIGS